MYTLGIVLHAVVAVLGAGPIGAAVVAVAAARRAGMSPAQVAPWLGPLLRSIRWALALLVLTGLWIDFAVGGAYHRMWWMRISMLLVVLVFFLQRRAVAALDGALRGEREAAGALLGIERSAWSMCGTVALITSLMEMKPF